MIKHAVKITVLLAAFAAITAASAYLALTLIIQSEESVVVPELAGKDVVYALELLAGLELDIKLKGSEYSSSVPKNHVVFQQPDPGAEIKKGRDVKIVLSKGPQTVSAPDLQGLPSRRARLMLEELGLCAGNLSRSFHASVDAGHVIAQYPFAGAETAQMQCVDLLISNGRRPGSFIMPRITGMPLDRAVVLLEGEKLRVDRVEGRWDRHRDADTVLAQEPIAGAPVTGEIPIRLVVNRSAEDSPAGGRFADRMQLFSHQTGSGYLRKHVRITVGSGDEMEERFNDFVGPGVDIWLAVPAGSMENVRVYENDRLVENDGGHIR